MIVLSLYRGLIDVSKDPRPPGGLRTMLNEVAAYYAIPLDALTSASRKQKIAHARQAFMWNARQLRWADGRHRYSYPQIGRFLGMHHTTVIFGEAQYAKRLAEALAVAA